MAGRQRWGGPPHLCAGDGLAQGLGGRRLGRFERRPHVAPGVLGVRLVEHFELARHDEPAQPLRRDGLLAPVADPPAAVAVHQQRGHPAVALASRQRQLHRRGVQIRTLAQDGDFEAAHEQLAQRPPLPLVPHARAAHGEADMPAPNDAEAADGERHAAATVAKLHRHRVRCVPHQVQRRGVAVVRARDEALNLPFLCARQRAPGRERRRERGFFRQGVRAGVSPSPAHTVS